MILEIINYSLDQKLYEYNLKKIDNNLVKINLEEKRFVLYFSNLQGPVKGRKPSERRIQINPSLKEKLHTYMGEDYEIILLGYDKITNTFSFWKYGYDINLKSTQSLPTTMQTLNVATNKGFCVHYYKNRGSFDSFRQSSFVINAFLFPLILENYNKIFNREIKEIFGKKIKNWNKNYRKDELILCLDLYYQKYPLTKNSPEILEISDFCKRRSDLIGFINRFNYYHEKISQDFRNINGIGKKIENIASADPLKNLNRKGLVPDLHAKKILLRNYITKSNQLDKQKLFQDAVEIKKRILSNRIDILVGKEKIQETSNEKIKFYDEVQTNILLDFDLNQKHTKSSINPDNFSDPIEAINARDRATKLHEEILKKLAKMCDKKNLPIKKSVHIDFYTEYKNRGKLFELKTFNNTNFNQQIRHGIIQLKEYYFRYAKYTDEILRETDLFLLLNDNPEKIIEGITIRFLKDQNITLCWMQNNKIVTFKKDKLSDTRPAIKWLL
jgi:hypothetical protein